ncbi:MAG: helix-turn-helix domain-containing protein [Nocardioides sp.]|nr:helix-turn-helix domain-containing protein [Nocardioides sp.]
MPAEPGPRLAAARERLLEAACALFSARGVRDVGVDELVASASVAKATFYKYFPSKDDLVLAVLDQHAFGWVRAMRERAADASPADRAEVLFDLLADATAQVWDPVLDPSVLVRVALELGPKDPAGARCLEHLDAAHDLLADLAQAAGVAHPVQLADTWRLLLLGALTATLHGDAGAGERARVLGAGLVTRPIAARFAG